LAGKWICPMHSEIIKDSQEPCDICGMDLIKTSEFGFADEPSTQKQVLTIPKTAPLITGKRAVVYVENETLKNTTKRYEGREVVLGPRAGENYVVLSGLKEGERVVVKGNFKIDSALQIQAKPSMMSPAGYYTQADNVFTSGPSSSGQSANILATALPYYLSTSQALAEDSFSVAVSSLKQFKVEIEKIISVQSLANKEEGLAKEMNLLKKMLDKIATEIDSLRTQFSGITSVLQVVFDKYEYKEDLKLYLNFCPMAFGNKGGYWLQDSKEIKNPYFGAKMLRCGELKKEYGRKIIKMEPKGSMGQKGSMKH
jgi:Cu(I)/Ag(I) efflux system membrane fusion protein